MMLERSPSALPGSMPASRDLASRLANLAERKVILGVDHLGWGGRA
jgi:hypothetical protein